MDSRNRDLRSNAIREYILYKTKELKKHNIYLSEEQIEKAVEKYKDLPWNMRDIEKQIDKDINEIIEQQKLQQQLRDSVLEKIEANKELENEEIPIEYIDKDMDKETKDIMNINNVENIDDLKSEIKEAVDKDPSLAKPTLTDKQVLTAKNEIYRVYQDTEIDKNEYQKDSSTMIKKKMEYLKDQGELTEQEKDKIGDIVEKSSTTDEVINKVENNFEETDTHDIYETTNDELNDMFVEKEPPQEVIQSSKEKPKTYIKTEKTNEGTESGFVSLTLIVIGILTVLVIIIETLLIMTS